MDNLRIFYIIQPEESLILQWLDILRILANPHARRRAHMTVKGPYGEQKNVHHDSNLLKGRPLRLIGADAFWGDQQSTALLRIGSDYILEQIWDKPSYTEFNPHITICDKLDRQYTEEVLSCIQKIRPMVFHAGELQPLFSGLNNEVSELLGSIDYEFLEHILGRALDAEMLKKADQKTRLAWLDQVINFQSNLPNF